MYVDWANKVSENGTESPLEWIQSMQSENSAPAQAWASDAGAELLRFFPHDSELPSILKFNSINAVKPMFLSVSITK